MKIVYLHGFASSPQSSKARFFAQKFAERGIPFTAPALDGGDFEHLTISSQLKIVEQTCQHQPVTLIGSSLGGYLAALYAARYPEVAQVILLAPAFAFPGGWQRRLGPEAMEQWRKTDVLPVFHYGEGRGTIIRFGLVEDAQSYEDYPLFPQPTLIFHGENDEIVPAELSRTFAARRPNATLRVFPNAGHELTDVTDQIWADVSAMLFN